MDATAKTLYTAVQAINGLKVLFAPILPFTSQRLHELLGEEGTIFGEQRVETYSEPGRTHRALTYDAAGSVGQWKPTLIPAGRTLPQPQPLFTKLEEQLAEEELARIGAPERRT